MVDHEKFLKSKLGEFGYMYDGVSIANLTTGVRGFVHFRDNMYHFKLFKVNPNLQDVGILVSIEWQFEDSQDLPKFTYLLSDNNLLNCI